MEERKVIKIERIKNEDVYDITTEFNHNFFANGILIHNCGEIPMEINNVCLLGSMNLTQYVVHNLIDFEKLKHDVAIAVRFLDNVNDVSNAPLKEYKDSMKQKRRIGLGVMGLGSALNLMQIPFDDFRAFNIAREISKTITHTAYLTSAKLAKEKGMFPRCIPDLHTETDFFKNLQLPKSTIDLIKEYGIRNITLIMVAPTGNSGILANNVSGGIEPIFKDEYVRTVIVDTIPENILNEIPDFKTGEFYETELFKFKKEGDETILKGEKNGVVFKIDKNRGLTKEVLCEDYSVKHLKEFGVWSSFKPNFVSAEQLSVDDHLRSMQTFSKYVCNSISKTINLPEKYTLKKFKDLYLDAFNTSTIKGITTYRSGTMTSVLSIVSDEEEIIKNDVKLPHSSPAVIKTIRAAGKKWYITVVFDENKHPFALFVKTNNPERGVTTENALDLLRKLASRKKIPKRHIDVVLDKIQYDSNSSKIARIISFLLRHGVLIKNIVSTLDKVDNIVVGSFIFQIKKFLSAYIKNGEKSEEKCPDCEEQLIFSEGCLMCRNCGFAKCG